MKKSLLGIAALVCACAFFLNYGCKKETGTQSEKSNPLAKTYYDDGRVSIGCAECNAANHGECCQGGSCTNMGCAKITQGGTTNTRHECAHSPDPEAPCEHQKVGTGYIYGGLEIVDNDVLNNFNTYDVQRTLGTSSVTIATGRTNPLSSGETIIMFADDNLPSGWPSQTLYYTFTIYDSGSNVIATYNWFY